MGHVPCGALHLSALTLVPSLHGRLFPSAFIAWWVFSGRQQRQRCSRCWGSRGSAGHRECRGEAPDLQHVKSWTKGRVSGQGGTQDLQGSSAAQYMFVLKIWNCFSLKELS